jgi:hypothetical protein
MSGEEYDFTNIIDKPIVIIIFVFLVVVYMIYIYATSTSSSSSYGKDYYNVFESDSDYKSFSDNDSISSGIFAKVIIVLFILVVVIKGYQVLFNKTITASFSDFFTNQPKVDIHLNTPVVDTAPTETNNTPILDKFGLEPVSIQEGGIKQVFNVPGNIYTYDNAKALCKAYDGRLATYDEIENAYKKGGEWCNYGWSEGQNVYFPTQEKTYNTLQGIEGHENDCGRPGINGGYIDNPKVRFGANCYGRKPLMTQDEKEIMDSTPLYPLNKKDVWFNKQVDYFKTQLDNILISPFNKQSWSASFI